MDVFSPAQWLGYLAFVLGVSAFLQRSDRRLKYMVAAESAAYAAHFLLLGNGPATSSALLTAFRSVLAARSRSPWLAGTIVALNVALGALVSKGGMDFLPVIASSMGTVAVFLLQGIPMRLTLLCATGLWLANNILSRSIGGTLLETTIALTSVFTILRMLAGREDGPAPIIGKKLPDASFRARDEDAAHPASGVT